MGEHSRLTIQTVDLAQKKQVQQFIQFPFDLYRNDPHWVPPLWIDMEFQLNKRKNPFFEHSEADFFVALQDGQLVGRIAAIENRHYNEFHRTKKAQFYYFECIEDYTVAVALFERVRQWAQQRELDTLIGPKGLVNLDGFGMLMDGFDQRTMMTMMNYNPPYYPVYLERMGFTKEVDFVSCLFHKENFPLPERIYRIAERVEQRGELKVHRFRTIKEVKVWAKRIGEAFNKAFVNNWEFAPLTRREVQLVVDTLEMIADPRMIKIITHKDEIVGFLFAFPDLADSLKRHRGRLFPFGLIDLLLEKRRTQWAAVNTMGILPEFQGIGGNALLYTEMEKTLLPRFSHYALYQVAETSVNMRRDLINGGAVAYKNHRVFRREVFTPLA